MIKAMKRYAMECFLLAGMVYFRPQSFRRQIEKLGRKQIWRLIIQSIIVLFVIPLLFTVITGLALKLFGVDFYFTRGLSKVIVLVVSGLTLGVGIGTVVGVAFAVVFGATRSVAYWATGMIISCLTVGIGTGVVGITHGIAGKNTILIVSLVMCSLALSSIISVAGSLDFGLRFVIGLTASFTILHAVFPITKGNSESSFVILYQFMKNIWWPAIWYSLIITALYSRLLLLPFEVILTLLCLWRAKRSSQQVARFLRQPIAYWDEAMLFPQPYLFKLLIIVGKQDKEAARNAISHLVMNTFQKEVAERALLTLVCGELFRCDTVENIARCDVAAYWLSTIGSPGRFLQATEAIVKCQNIITEVGAATSATSNYSKLAIYHRTKRRLEELSHYASEDSLELKNIPFKRPLIEKYLANRIIVITQNWLTAIVEQWRKAVDAEIERLTEEEDVFEKIPNPYIAPNPLGSGSEMFFGRYEAFRFVEEHFLREGESAPIVLYGQPRIGKTSVLKNLQRRLTTSLIPIYADMQASAQVESTGGLLFNLSKTIGQQLAQRELHIEQPSLGDFTSEPFIVFDNYLDKIELAIREPDTRIILALDEFEEIEKKLTAGEISKDLMSYLRSMMQSRSRIRMLFAGTHTLDEMISGLWTPYFRSAVPCRISYLDDASARSLITNPIKDFSLDYEPEAVNLLIEQTNCHPCLIQLSCSVLVDMKNAQKSRYVSVQDVKQACDKVLRETGEYVFRGIWDIIPQSEQKLLAALASSRTTLAEQLTQAPANPEVEISAMIEHLIESEMLTRSEAGCRFQVALFQQWVARHAARTGMVGGGYMNTQSSGK